MRELIERIFLSAFDNSALRARHDSAVLPEAAGRLAFTSDAYVVRPLFFPGGDIGKLSITGTVNDLAMAGAVPEYLSASFILEEGFELDVLARIVQSMARAACDVGVSIVTGDTKVVDRGHGDGVYITTSGIGRVLRAASIAPAFVEPGDVIVVSGDIGRHGIAVLSVREGLAFETALESDCGELVTAVRALIDSEILPHCLRDLTRGGLAAALYEIATDANLVLSIDETLVPVSEAVRGAAEILGLDPLYIACEGRFIAVVREQDLDGTLRTLAQFGEPACVGQVSARAEHQRGRVEVGSGFGGTRLLELFYGEQLPRIC